MKKLIFGLLLAGSVFAAGDCNYWLDKHDKSSDVFREAIINGNLAIARMEQRAMVTYSNYIVVYCHGGFPRLIRESVKLTGDILRKHEELRGE